MNVSAGEHYRNKKAQLTQAFLEARDRVTYSTQLLAAVRRDFPAAWVAYTEVHGNGQIQWHHSELHSGNESDSVSINIALLIFEGDDDCLETGYLVVTSEEAAEFIKFLSENQPQAEGVGA